jgi:hypothetical protein
MEETRPKVVLNPSVPLPAAWREFIRYCRELRYGEIERLSIQDGVPVLAEITRKKVKFSEGAQ